MKLFITSSLVTLGLFTQLWAADTTLLDIQHRWAEINYQMEDNAQEDAFNKLIVMAEKLVAADPRNPNNLIWLGIIQSSTAGAKGGLGALSFAKAAKKSLEDAIAMDPNALSGSALTSLGVLYHKVPGWPVAFGSDDKAKELLIQSLKVNPKGIDSNYFYAEFLFDDGKYTDAKRYLEMAQKAAPRPDRPVADMGRREEIVELMKKVDKKL